MKIEFELDHMEKLVEGGKLLELAASDSRNGMLFFTDILAAEPIDPAKYIRAYCKAQGVCTDCKYNTKYTMVDG